MEIFGIHPYIAPDLSLCWSTPISKYSRPEIKRLLSDYRFHVDYIDNGNIYVSDEILRTNGYMIAGKQLVVFSDGSALAIGDLDFIDKFIHAGSFNNYEDEHDNG